MFCTFCIRVTERCYVSHGKMLCRGKQSRGMARYRYHTFFLFHTILVVIALNYWYYLLRVNCNGLSAHIIQSPSVECFKSRLAKFCLTPTSTQFTNCCFYITLTHTTALLAHCIHCIVTQYCILGSHALFSYFYLYLYFLFMFFLRRAWLVPMHDNAQFEPCALQEQIDRQRPQNGSSDSVNGDL